MINNTARQHYLETQVLTATPQKLQLMLIEAAIREVQRMGQHWERCENEQAYEAGIRAQRIVTALLSGLNREEMPDLTGRMAEVYLYVFRTLVTANMRHEEQLLADALRVLNVERETWQLVCQRAESERTGPDLPPPEPLQGPHKPPAAAMPTSESEMDAGGFSVEA